MSIVPAIKRPSPVDSHAVESAVQIYTQHHIIMSHLCCVDCVLYVSNLLSVSDFASLHVVQHVFHFHINKVNVFCLVVDAVDVSLLCEMSMSLSN